MKTAAHSAASALPTADVELGPRLAVEASTARTITASGRELLFLGGCNYLALSHDPRVIRALEDGARRHGVTSGGARETTGNVREHEALERELAAALDVEDALLLPEGACASLAFAESLGGEFAFALADQDAHPTLLQAARASGTPLETFADADSARAALAARGGDAVIWTDGVFPSAGRAAPLARLLEALPPGRGLLAVDDAHGFGVLGPRGRGSVEAAGLRDPRIVVIGTLSKALGTYGGFVAGARERVAAVRRRSALYAGTTPLAPALAAAARTALAIHVGEPERHAAYVRSVRTFRARMAEVGVPLQPLEFPVCAFELESRERMQAVHEFALGERVFLPLIRYAGGGPHGFFRIAWNAAHTAEDLDRACDVLRRALESA